MLRSPFLYEENSYALRAVVKVVRDEYGMKEKGWSEFDIKQHAAPRYDAWVAKRHLVLSGIEVPVQNGIAGEVSVFRNGRVFRVVNPVVPEKLCPFDPLTVQDGNVFSAIADVFQNASTERKRCVDVTESLRGFVPGGELAKPVVFCLATIGNGGDMLMSAWNDAQSVLHLREKDLTISDLPCSVLNAPWTGNLTGSVPSDVFVILRGFVVHGDNARVEIDFGRWSHGAQFEGTGPFQFDKPLYMKPNTKFDVTIRPNPPFSVTVIPFGTIVTPERKYVDRE